MKLFFLLLSVFSYNLSSQILATFVSTDYSTGKFAVLNNFNGTTNFTNNTYTGDVSVFTYNGFTYLLEVANPSKIHKYDINNPDLDLYTYGGEDGFPLSSLVSELCIESTYTGTNPVSIDFVSNTKAYLVLYNSAKVLIVNPSATTLAEFKIGEIDFSNYSDGDGCPETRAVKIFNNKAYFSLQNLARDNYWAASYDARILEVNITTDTIENEIALFELRNPNAEIKTYQDNLYISFQGPSYPVNEFYGGIVKVDTQGLYTDVLRGTSVTHFDFYNNDIYFLNYQGWEDVNLKKASLDNIQNTMAVAFGFNGQQNLYGLMVDGDNLWVLDRSTSNAGIHIANLITAEFNTYVLSNYPPYTIAKNKTTIDTNEIENTKLILYPNPSNGCLTIKLNDKAYKISISNIQGQVVKEIIKTASSFDINLQNLSPGIYIVKIFTIEKTYAKKLIIK